MKGAQAGGRCWWCWCQSVGFRQPFPLLLSTRRDERSQCSSNVACLGCGSERQRGREGQTDTAVGLGAGLKAVPAALLGASSARAAGSGCSVQPRLLLVLALHSQLTGVTCEHPAGDPGAAHVCLWGESRDRKIKQGGAAGIWGRQRSLWGGVLPSEAAAVPADLRPALRQPLHPLPFCHKALQEADGFCSRWEDSLSQSPRAAPALLCPDPSAALLLVGRPAVGGGGAEPPPPSKALLSSAALFAAGRGAGGGVRAGNGRELFLLTCLLSSAVHDDEDAAVNRIA